MRVAITSSTQNIMHPNLRPQRSTYIPRNVPKTAEDKNPVRNRVPTLTPYDYIHRQIKSMLWRRIADMQWRTIYKVYILVPCNQSASIIIKYTDKYCSWNHLNADVGLAAPFDSELAEKICCNPAVTSNSIDKTAIVLRDHTGQPNEADKRFSKYSILKARCKFNQPALTFYVCSENANVLLYKLCVS